MFFQKRSNIIKALLSQFLLKRILMLKRALCNQVEARKSQFRPHERHVRACGIA